MALIAISCEKIEEPWENPEEDSWIDIPVVIPRTLSAYSPEFGSQGSDSKTRALSEDLPESWDESETTSTRTYAVINPNEANEYIQYWSKGDAISLFLTTENLQYQKVSYMDGTLDIGKFELVGDEAEGAPLQTNYYYSVYPYKDDTKISKKGKVTYTFPATQHYSGDSYANGENGMIAIKPKENWKEDEDNVLYFKNFCSYLQLRLATKVGEEPKTVKQITLIANAASDKISGEGDITIKDTTSAPIVTMAKAASNQVTLDCGSGVTLSTDENEPTKFWFVLPGGFTFTQGFSVTVVFDDDTYFKQSTKKIIEIKRSHIKPMATFKPEYIQPTGPIRYKYNDPNIKEPYPLKNTFLGEDGMPLVIVDQVYHEDTKEWEVLLSGTLKTIGGNSFKEQSPNIEYIKINNGDEAITIGDFAFYNCTAESIQIYNDVQSINKAAFSGSTITDLQITGNVTVVKADAFSSCNEIKTVTIPKIETVEARAFYMCSSIENIDISNVKYIYDSAFEGCTGLQTISLGSVITIGDAAFMGCSGLTEVTISKHCTMIGEGAFCNATNLHTVYCYAVYPPFIKTDNDDASYVFDSVSDDIVIYIPFGSEEYYLDADYFEENPYDVTMPNSDFNWWEEDYEDILLEMAEPTMN